MRVFELSGGPRFLFALGAAILLLTGCSTAPKVAREPMIARFYLENRGEEPGQRVKLPQSGVEIVVDPKPVVMEFDIIDAEVAQVALGKCLMLKLTTAATRDLYRISGASLGRRLVLSLNDEPLGARRLDEPVGESAVLFFVERPDEQLPGMVERLKGTSADVQRELARKR